MNRIIEFRAWDSGKYYLESEIAYITQTGKVALMNGNVLIKPKLLQFTGLTDVNGVKIFEGDIIHIDKIGKNNEVWSVEYDDKNCCFSVYNQLNSFRKFNYDFEAVYTECPIIEITPNKRIFPKVLGNIFENPELL